MEQEFFSVNQGYKIALTFFLDLWFLLETEISELSIKDDEILTVHELFFRQVCLGFESTTEWLQAVFQAKHVPQEEQKQLQLTEVELFSCAIEFCKLHNERWRNLLNGTVCLLEAMQRYPEQHSREWGIWEKNKQHLAIYPDSFYDVDWSILLPEKPYTMSQQIYIGGGEPPDPWCRTCIQNVILHCDRPKEMKTPKGSL